MRANNGALMTPTLIVTRPKAQSDAFAAQVQAAYGQPLSVIVSPLIEIRPVPATVPQVDAVIFTSANGVQAAAALGLPQGLQAWCVGGKTAAAAQAAGFDPITGPGDAEGLLHDILSARPAGSIAHIRGKHARGDLAARLTAAGIDCADIVAYDQVALDLNGPALKALGGQNPVVLPLFSPRSCTILYEQGPFTAPIHAVALSNAVAESLPASQGWSVKIASRPDSAAMLEAVLGQLGDEGTQR